MKYHFAVILWFLVFFFNKKINAQETIVHYGIFGAKLNVGGISVGGFYSDMQFGYFFMDKFNKSSILNVPNYLTSICGGVETNYSLNEFKLIPKISFEHHHTDSFFSYGLQARYYPAKNMDFSKTSIQLCPQIGTNLFCIAYVTFGYSFGITNRDITPDLGFQLNFGVNLFKRNSN